MFRRDILPDLHGKKMIQVGGNSDTGQKVGGRGLWSCEGCLSDGENKKGVRKLCFSETNITLL
jgi:hypothetical protein